MAASTGIWTVDDEGGADFKTIQEAINAANPGDTIFVHSGTYYENVVVNKSITLIGENRDFTIINGTETGSVVTIEADNVSVQGFTIMKSNKVFPHAGIFVKPPYRGNVIANNRVIENYYGISLAFGGDSVYGNIISNNTCDGIRFFNSFNNFVSDNVISFNELAGISLYNSEGNMIYGNTISDNLFYGIFIYSSVNNMISANTIVNNPSAGVFIIFSSNNNTFYHNNFNNIFQVRTDGSKNFWSYNNEGNYWSNYNGTDFYSGLNQDRPGSDGIGEIPYNIDENNIDTRPLMGVFSKFDISYKGEKYQVNIISNSTISDFQFQIGTETGNKIMRFKPIGNESMAGFCRIMIPTELMSYPYIIFFGYDEISPTFLDVSNETNVYLYFTYLHENQSVTIISSELYSELLDIFYDLNATYYQLLSSYAQLQRNFEELNASYQYLYNLNETFFDFLEDYEMLQENFYSLNATYYDLIQVYGELRKDFSDLNVTYQELFNAFVLLLGNYTQLQEKYQELSISYQDHLRSYSENVSNVQNLTYVLAAVTAILIIVTTYLSKCAHSSSTQKIKRFGAE
jgi:parallel beta-helix repeat protein